MGLNNQFAKGFTTSPLTLDRVLEGRPITERNSRLLNLPVEILSLVIKYVDINKEGLPSLALVNSDCRQLARSCQFRNVVIDFGPRSSCVLGILIHEAAERFRSENGLTRRPSLGACVRCIRTSSDHYWKEIQNIRPRASESDEGDDGVVGLGSTLSLDQWRESVGNMTTRMACVYNPSLVLVISTLPNLEILNWAGEPPLIAISSTVWRFQWSNISNCMAALGRSILQSR